MKTSTDSCKSIASLIAQKIAEDTDAPNRYKNSGAIKYVVFDDLLPRSLAEELYQNFPENDDMTLRSGLQERKYISVEFPLYSSIVQDCLYAFQEQIVIDSIGRLCGIEDLSGDTELYAGGVSSMTDGCYLNPHIDNSHDRLRQRYRRLNMLYYVSAEWDSDTEGCLQLWSDGLKCKPISIPSSFNKLVIMATDKNSIHSVSRISNQPTSRRLCISNYYFSPNSAEGDNYYHSTSFRGFPDELAKDWLLRTNAQIRTKIKSMTGTFFGSVISDGHFRKDNER